MTVPSQCLSSRCSGPSELSDSTKLTTIAGGIALQSTGDRPGLTDDRVLAGAPKAPQEAALRPQDRERPVRAVPPSTTAWKSPVIAWKWSSPRS